MKIPWLRIGSSPVEILIEGLYIIISPQQKSQWESIDIFNQSVLESVLTNMATNISNELIKQANPGYFKRLIMKIFDNIQIKVIGVHIRYEDHYSASTPFSFGVVMENLKLCTTNKNWEHEYIDRTEKSSSNIFKLLNVKGLGLYLNPAEQIIIHQLTQENEKRLEMMDELWKRQKLSFLGSDLQNSLQFILSPMNLKVNLIYQLGNAKKIDANIDLERIQFFVLKQQLKCFIKFQEQVSEYNRFRNYQVKTKKFKFLRPVDDKVTKGNAKQWWRFAYQCIKRGNMARNGSLKSFIITKMKMMEYEAQFKILFSSLYQRKKKDKWKANDHIMFRNILLALEVDQLRPWVEEVIQKIDAKNIKQQDQPEKKIDHKKVNSQGSTRFLKWFFKPAQEEVKGLVQKLETEELEEMTKELEQDLEEEDNQEEKQALNLTLRIQDAQLDLGEVNQKSHIEGLTLYTKQIMVTFKTFDSRQTSFQVNGSIMDLGVDIFNLNQQTGDYLLQEPVIMSNKRLFPMSIEEQFKLVIRKNPQELQNVDFDIEIIANPLILKYQKEFLKRIMILSRLKMSEQVSNAAIDTLEKLRDVTSNQIHQIIFKKINRFRMNVASPVILLPFTGDFETDTPLFVIRLGDFQVASAESKQSSSALEYEQYDLLVDSIRMQYFESYGTWVRTVENVKNLRDKTYVSRKTFKEFSIIEDCWMKFNVQIKQKRTGQSMLSEINLKEYQQKPKVIMKGRASDFNININQRIYIQLANISKLFKIENDPEYTLLEQEMIQSKNYAIENARISGFCRKRLDPVKYWQKFFCILEGSYLYFYSDQKQLMPSTYFSIKDATVQDKVRDAGVLNSISIQNKNNDCLIAFDSDIQMKEWITALRYQIYELKQEQVQEVVTYQKKKPQKQINYDSIKLQLEFFIPTLKAQILKENKEQFTDWIEMTAYQLEIQQTKQVADQQIKLKVIDIQVIDKELKVNSTIICQGQSFSAHNQDNIIEVCLTESNKKSPHYKNIDSLMEVKLSNIDCNFHPQVVNDFLKFARNTQKIISDSNQKDLLSQIQAPDSPRVKSQDIDPKKETCKEISEALIKIVADVNGIKLRMLHSQYLMEMYRFDSSSCQVVFTSYYDHYTFETSLKDLTLYDLTNYPYTLNPKDFLSKPQNFKQERKQIASIISSQNKMGLYFLLETYSSNCCPIKREGFSSKMKLTAQTVKVQYIQELVMRIYQYFFEQFLNALMNSNPFMDRTKEIQEIILRRQTIKSDVFKHLKEFQQETQIFDMDMNVSNIDIVLKDRLKSSEYLNLNIDNVNIKESMIKKSGRVKDDRQQQLLIVEYRIACSKISMKFCNIPLTKEPFHMLFLLQKLSFSPIFRKTDPTTLDQSLHMELDFEPIQLKLPQDIYTYILRCLDLNINYTDCLTSQYFFFQNMNIEEYQRKIAKVASMKISLNFKQLSLALSHDDGTLITDIVLKNMNYSLVQYMDLVTKQKIKCQLLNFINPQFQAHQPPQLVLQMQMQANGDKHINADISRLNLIIKPHIFLMLYYYFLNAFPHYDSNSVDKPSAFNEDAEDFPKIHFNLNIINSLLCLENRPGLKTIACEGTVNYEFRRERIKEKKGQFYQDDGERGLSFTQENQDINLEGEELNKGIWYMSFSILDLCPFICSLSQLNSEKDFSKVKKRQLVSPFNISYSNKFTLIQFLKQQCDEDFGVDQVTQINLGKAKMKLSIKDMHLIFQITTFANENVNKLVYEPNQLTKVKSNTAFSKIVDRYASQNRETIYQKSPTKISIFREDLIDKSVKSKDQVCYDSEGDVEDQEEEKETHSIKIQGLNNLMMKDLRDNRKKNNFLFKSQITEKNPFNNRAFGGGLMTRNQNNLLSVPSEEFKDTLSQPFYSFVGQEIQISPIAEEKGEEAYQYRITKESIKKLPTVLDNVRQKINTIECQGVSILFINDFDQVFCPVLDLDIPEIKLKYDDKGVKKVIDIQIPKAKAQYFNALIGEWEPFLESFGINCKSNQENTQRLIAIEFPKSININITERCLQNLIESYYAWMQTPAFELDEEHINRQEGSRNSFMKSRSMRSMNDGSINKDMAASRGQSKDELSKSMLNEWLNEDNEFDQVTPYSIVNLTDLVFKVIGKSQISNEMMHYQEEELKEGDSNHDSGFKVNQRTYKLRTGDECDYAVEYEQQTRFIQEKQQKKKSKKLSSSEIDGRMANNFNTQVDASKKSSGRQKNQDIVNIVFKHIRAIQNINLNEIQQNKTLLLPIQEQIDRSITDNAESILELIGEDYSLKKKKKQNQQDLRLMKYLVYGVTMQKMRKVLVVRNPYTIYNHTMYEYFVKISQRNSNEIKEIFVLKPEKSHPINFDYYQDHNIQFKIKLSKEQRPNDLNDAQSVYSKIAYIENTLLINLNAGLMIKHDNSIYTYAKKSQNELKGAYDFMLVPPLVVTNALPCFLDILSSQNFNNGVLNTDLEGQIFSFDKGEERHFHIFTFTTETTDEMIIKFRVRGYTWAELKVKNTLKQQEDQDITLTDQSGCHVQICARLQTQKALFHITFFAHTCIINHSLLRLEFHYDTLNKPLIAGQDISKDYCLANKDQAIVAHFKNDHSKPLKIKNIGIKESFEIEAQATFFSTHQKKVSADQGLHSIQQRSLRYEFVYTTSLSLVLENDYIYTKIIQIQPKYVIVNKMRSSICVSQVNCSNFSIERIDPEDRREWVWADSLEPKQLIVKKEDSDIEYQFKGDPSFEQIDLQEPSSWKWSQSFDINEQGIMTIQINKVKGGDKSPQSKKIIRITRKQIDATTFVIFEDENDGSPYYKLENYSQNILVRYVQESFDFVVESERLLPNQETSFAFIDPKVNHAITCHFILLNELEHGEDEIHKTLCSPLIKTYNFESMDLKDIITYDAADGSRRNLYIRVFTNGVTKIIRFSDKSLVHDQREVENKDEEVKMMNTNMQLTLSEMNISFINTVTQSQNDRKEIALLSICDVQFISFISSKWKQGSLKIGIIQIDNQSNVNALFPTIFQPKLFKQIRQNMRKSMVEISIFVNAEKPEVFFVDEMEVILQGICIKLDDEFLGFVLAFVYDTLEKMKTNLTGIHPLFIRKEEINIVNVDISNVIDHPSGAFKSLTLKKDNSGYTNSREQLFQNSPSITVYRRSTAKFHNIVGVITSPGKINIQNTRGVQSVKDDKRVHKNPDDDNQYQSWLCKRIDDSQQRIYVNNCKLSKLQIDLSFLARKNFQLGELEDTLQLKSFMNSSGLALMNIDEAPLDLKELTLNQVFGYTDDIANMLIEHYKEGIKKNFFKIIGSAGLIGNPRKLVKTIGTGFSDFYNGQGIKGKVIGTGSLLKNTIEGTFGSVQAITASVSKGMLLLSLDQDYLYRREELLLTEKPKNIVEGVGFGCKSAINSLGSGLSGVVTRPIEEVKKRGAKGIAIGMVSGMTGLFLKPLSGGLDLVAKSTEGVKNTARIFDAQITIERHRLPRAFYGNNKQIKVFSESDSYIVNRILPTIKEGYFSKDIYIETIKYEEGEEGVRPRTLFLIITEKHLILMEAAQKSVWWHIDIKKIETMERYQNGLMIKLTSKFEGKSQVAMEINNQRIIDKVYDKLKPFTKVQYY